MKLVVRGNSLKGWYECTDNEVTHEFSAPNSFSVSAAFVTWVRGTETNRSARLDYKFC